MRKKRVLVTGCSGYLGSRFCLRFNSVYDIQDIAVDIRYRQGVLETVKASDCDVILHLAAKTHIDTCENDKVYGKKGIVWQINVEGTRNIVDACEEYKKYLILLSTECIFDGRLGWYSENDCPDPKNWYGTTKAFAEGEILDRDSNACILRSVLAYGQLTGYQHDLVSMLKNYLSQEKHISVVCDQIINPTYIEDLLDVIHILIKKRPRHLYHFAGLQSLTPYAFAKKFCRYFGYAEHLLKPVTLKEYFGDRSALRLTYATLDCQKIVADLGIRTSDMEHAFQMIKNADS